MQGLNKMKAKNEGRVWLMVMGVALSFTLTQQGGQQAAQEEVLSVIIQGSDIAALSAAVQGFGGDVTHELAIINAIGAELTTSQLHALKNTGLVKRIYRDAEAHAAQVEQVPSEPVPSEPVPSEPVPLEPVPTEPVSSELVPSDYVPEYVPSERVPSEPPKRLKYKKDKHARDTFYPTMIGADELHKHGFDGTGVTVAVVDTGLWEKSSWLAKNMYNQKRELVRYDAIADKLVKGHGKWKDGSGHGTHVTSVMLSGRRTFDDISFTGAYNGVSPGINIVSVKAFDENGVGTYRDVIRGIAFVVENKDVYNIRVLNLSFSATPQSHYWDDPLNQAVMRA